MYKVVLDVTESSIAINEFLNEKAKDINIRETRQGNLEITATFDLLTDVETFRWLTDYYVDYSAGEFVDTFVEIL
uniref:Uncharacterized protein n=1 Tax=Ochrobactrum phage ORM_20 TaxID=2985243 RepID=A0A9N6WS56_9VIRU|nr:hypothetical protein ORM20_00173 [Ochrobactrum phage ORM_20]